MKTWDTVAIVGVGLIGGSIGLALRERGLARQVVGIGHRAVTLRTAKRRGAVTRTTTDLAGGVADAELIVLCSPVERIAEQGRTVAQNCSPGAVITDVGSTKEEIVTLMDQALSLHNPRKAVFVGSHPMAGSEKKGVQHASAQLFEGCVTIVTPTPQSPPTARRLVSRFWRALGSRVVEHSASDHDRAVASISHVPHLVAAALAAATPVKDLPLAAGGWRDGTRVAAGDPQLWRQILSQNRFHVLEALDHVIEEIAEYRRALAYNDREQIEKLLIRGKTVREEYQDRNGRPKKKD